MLHEIITEKTIAIVADEDEGLILQPNRDVVMHLSEAGWDQIEGTLKGAFKEIRVIWFHPYIENWHSNPIALRGPSKMTGKDLDYILCCAPVRVYHNLYVSALISNNNRLARTIVKATLNRAEDLEETAVKVSERSWLFRQCAKVVVHEG